MCLKNKRILITAGPTWVPIDAVRVISNSASGATGLFLSRALQGLGAKVTLLLGPIPLGDVSLKGNVPYFRIIRFKFFDELKQLLARQLKGAGFDAVIHTAAVSDYRPHRRCRGKIASGKSRLRLELYPTEKIIDAIKKYDPSVYLVGFKYHPGASRETLFREARALARRSKADLVVANSAVNNLYRAYLVKGTTCSAPLSAKPALARYLCRELEKEFK